MISTVVSGSSGELNMNTSVRSRRLSSPGNLRLSALKWFDMVSPMWVIAWVGGGPGRPRAVRPAPGWPGLAAQEVQQGGVDLAGVGPGDGVRAALDDDELDILDQAGQSLAGLVDRQDLVGVALDDEDRYVDLGQVVAEVGGPGADAGHRGGGRCGDGEVPAGLVGLVADQGAAQGVGVVEVVQESLHPGRGIG